jgi:hypothetical protein
MLQDLAVYDQKRSQSGDRSLARHHLIIGAVLSLSTTDVPAQVVSYVGACSSPLPDRKFAALVSEQM